MYPRVQMVRGEVYGLLAVHMHVLVFGGVIGGASSDPQNVLFVMWRHGYALVQAGSVK